MKEDIFEINGTTYKVIIDDSGNKTVCKKLKNGSFEAPKGRKKYEVDLGWTVITVCEHSTTIDHNNWQEAWKKLQGSDIFESNGLFGCKNVCGTVLPALFDQIEFLHNGGIYLRGGKRFALFYENGGGSEEIYEKENSRFFEKGYAGWRGENDVIIPAMYDDVYKIYGLDVYETCLNCGYRYFNSNGLEILTAEKEYYDIPKDRPYKISVFNRPSNDPELITFIAPCDENPEDDSVVLTDAGKHVRLLSYTRDEIQEFMSEGCTDLKLEREQYMLFGNDFSYEFAGYIVYGNGDNPLKECMDKLKELRAHSNSWNYLFKISTAPGHKVSPAELQAFRHVFEDCDGICPLSLHVGIGEDNGLGPGTVEVTLVTFYNERCFPAPFETEWVGHCQKCTLEELLEHEKELKGKINNAVLAKYRDEVLADQYSRPFWNIRYNKNRSWEDTEKVLDFLAEKNPNYWKVSHAFLTHFDDWYFDQDENVMDKLEFSANVLRWAADRGCNLNHIIEGMTVLDHLRACCNEHSCQDEKTSVADKIIPYLIEKGAKTAEQIRAIEDASDYYREIEALQH